MPSKETQPKKRRGAPQGNLNALKHGFYSKAFRAAELEAVHDIEEHDVAQEIDLLRLIIKRTAESANKARDFESQVRFLSVLTYATAQLSRLLNLHETFERRNKSQQRETIPMYVVYQECLDELRAMRSADRAPVPGGPPASPTEAGDPRDHQVRASQAPTPGDPPEDDVVPNDSEMQKYTQAGFHLPEGRGDSF